MCDQHRENMYRVSDPDMSYPVFLPVSESGFHITLDPDPYRFSNFSGSGSGFSPDSGTKKIAESSLKVIYQKKT